MLCDRREEAEGSMGRGAERGTGGTAPNHSRRRGFSLLEVMVVLVIIGLIAGLVTINVRSRMPGSTSTEP